MVILFFDLDILRSVGQLGLSGEPSSTFSLPSVEPRKATVSITAATPKVATRFLQQNRFFIYYLGSVWSDLDEVW